MIGAENPDAPVAQWTERPVDPAARFRDIRLQRSTQCGSGKQDREADGGRFLVGA